MIRHTEPKVKGKIYIMREKNVASIGNRIRLARVGLNLTQKQLAEAVNIGANYLAMVERGSRNASDKLIKKIATATHTTYEWLMGTSEHQTAYPEPDGSLEQINDNTASLGYLVELIREGCAEKDWVIEEPVNFANFQKTNWLPDYWFEVKDAPIEYWAFDFNLCIYKRPVLGKDGTVAPAYAYANFLKNMVLSNPLIRNETKYTLVVPNREIFESMIDKLPLDIGNLSVMQIDIPNKKIVREKYIAAQSDKKTYLTKTLQF